jgi:hypothetical protein
MKPSRHGSALLSPPSLIGRERLEKRCPSDGGPRVRILLPPPASLVRTGLSRGDCRPHPPRGGPPPCLCRLAGHQAHARYVKLAMLGVPQLAGARHDERTCTPLVSALFSRSVASRMRRSRLSPFLERHHWMDLPPKTARSVIASPHGLEARPLPITPSGRSPRKCGARHDRQRNPLRGQPEYAPKLAARTCQGITPGASRRLSLERAGLADFPYAIRAK